MDPAAHTALPRFQLAVSLGGGVSTGCWAAGVLDVLVEALDAWEQARLDGREEAPRHEVLLASIAGSSAGAETAVLLAIALRSRFPHVRLAGAEVPADALRNPLYAGWVEGADVQQLLDVQDGSDRVFRSLLDGTCTDRIVERALATPRHLPQLDPPRRWVATPLRVAVTVTNLEGVPVSVSDSAMAPARAFRVHADVLRFSLHGLGGTPSPEPARRDELELAYPASPAALPKAWSRLTQAAVASGAFPLLLPVRVVEWPRRAYDAWRIATLPSTPAGPTQPVLVPRWEKAKNSDEQVRFTAADGGVLNGAPVDIAREPLQGESAVLLIHPLLDETPVEPPPAAALHRALPHRLMGALARAVWNDARVSAQDVVAAIDERNPARFLIAPARPDDPRRQTSRALAGASVGAFGGYLHPDYRRHDYQLGRTNARWALEHHLTLPENHPLFAQWTCTQRTAYRVQGATGPELPIVPLMPELRRAAETPLRWPDKRDPTASLAPLIDRRLDAVVRGLLHAYLPCCRLGRTVLRLLWAWLVARPVRNAALRSIRRNLQSWGL